MSGYWAERRSDRRGFRPTLDGTLETRVLMAHLSSIRAHTAAGGQAVVITNTSGFEFFVSTVYGGTVRALPASGGRANLIVDGSTASTLLEINRIVPGQVRNSAHTFDPYPSTPNNRLNIASLNVTSGIIGAIEGYQTADLSGTITSNGTARVDRIALNSILPGGSIRVGGDLNTLDVYHDVNLSGGTISVGRDLNWFESYGNVTLSNNASFLVGRDVGNSFQVAKGSGNFGQGINITGNLTINPGSALLIARRVPSPAGVVINGNLFGGTRIFLGGAALTGLPFNFAVSGNIAG